ncbi:hypothetical protein [Halobacillus seohaensis]|uniref:Helix-turn-helix domain-containing protein n=1 Tax=Halobacillus seohaensis TaxID=447421 RepID=A0ABW2EJA6_9BACI
MNYIKELNAFYNQIELHSLSSSAIVLWGALMHFNNISGWKKEFSVAASSLRSRSGLRESSFNRGCTELKEKGFIKHRSVHRNHAPIYQM